MNQLQCPLGCGRTFDDNKRMEDHIKTRNFLQQKANPILQENTNIKITIITQQSLVNSIVIFNNLIINVGIRYTTTITPKTQLKIQLQFKKNTPIRLSSNVRKIDDVQKVDHQKDKEQNDNKETQQTIKIIEPSPVISANDLMEARKVITKQFICTNITNLSLIHKNLLIFESTTEVPFSELISALKSLSLSQNNLINVIGISVLQNIVDLNVNNNKITTLQPLGDCKRLQRLYANHNLINSIELGLMIHLKIFQIGDNQLLTSNY
ncbi:unnamed protein product (macronuclear) [Paramecium tetraurelia]|uniref:C2H2-type domain-containing protein n=1 Tax=Paramecium tetraurelia TaxID=5888 RepID=A0EDC6_PARTE|nr:uncharacterized protein GSPATT00004162001 [Paramecium tetraurelia]CAK93293.1 unnamed protein product [Paramecium tetraurelia]|eukprot:XP_001460690.1 hypothetical protein (macronuclear) [Paramecium tetraurelia strain d4-2]